MRIAIASWSRRQVGGSEVYLNNIIPELVKLNYEVAFWHEMDEPAGRSQITLPDGVPSWCVKDWGGARALTALREWNPDLIYAHGLRDPALEAATLTIAPGVFYAHAHYGTCISGSRVFQQPSISPCQRRFGARCLVSYLPRRCGGLNPLTMIREYRLQESRLRLLRKYKVILTNSNHMRLEYARHELQADCAPLPVEMEVTQLTPRQEQSPWRLLFLGRMDKLKGGRILLEALPQVQAALGRLHVDFAGDGPAKSHWQQYAAQLSASHPELSIRFHGWIGRADRQKLFAQTDLLVMPSVWAEPFGSVGLEAGSHGIPTAAFDFGGIRDWLNNGVNGYLAASDPPTAAGLGDAIVRCLHSPETHARLRRGAVQVARRFTTLAHVDVLTGAFDRATHSM